MSVPTKLHLLLDGQNIWTDSTWHQAQRYLVDNMSVPMMSDLLDILGCPATQLFLASIPPSSMSV